MEEMGFGAGDGRRVFDPINGSVECVALLQSSGCANVSGERHASDVAGGRTADWFAPAPRGPRSLAPAGRLAGIAGKLETFPGADGTDREACLAGPACGRRGARDQ